MLCCYCCWWLQCQTNSFPGKSEDSCWDWVHNQLHLSIAGQSWFWSWDTFENTQWRKVIEMQLLILPSVTSLSAAAQSWFWLWIVMFILMINLTVKTKLLSGSPKAKNEAAWQMVILFNLTLSINCKPIWWVPFGLLNHFSTPFQRLYFDCSCANITNTNTNSQHQYQHQ